MTGGCLSMNGSRLPVIGNAILVMENRPASRSLRSRATRSPARPGRQTRHEVNQLRRLDGLGGVRLETGAEGAETVFGAGQGGEVRAGIEPPSSGGRERTCRISQ